MKITDIISQKNKKYFNILADEVFLCSMDRELIIQNHLTIGKEVDDEQIKIICEQALLKKAFHQSVTYLSYQMRTQKEIENYLQRKDYSEVIINKTIQKLINYRYIDDNNYMMMYIKSRLNSGNSKNKIQYKLIEKGLEQSQILYMLNKIYPHDMELEFMKKEILKLNKKHQNLPYRDKMKKITQSCLQKGYRIEDITKTLPEFVSEEETDEFILRFTKLADNYSLKFKKKGCSEREIEQKTMQALYRKGYNMDLIKKYFKGSDW